MGFLERVLPGYKGYKERETARDTDRLLREFLVAKLKEANTHYNDFKADLTRLGSLALMTPAEKVTQTMSRVTDRLRYANCGFSARWFGKKIGVNELEKVNQFDQQLATTVDEITKSIRSLNTLDDQDEITLALRQITKSVRALDEKLNTREQILRSFDGDGVLE
jgi:predicted transcriptional regulator